LISVGIIHKDQVDHLEGLLLTLNYSIISKIIVLDTGSGVYEYSKLEMLYQDLVRSLSRPIYLYKTVDPVEGTITDFGKYRNELSQYFSKDDICLFLDCDERLVINNVDSLRRYIESDIGDGRAYRWILKIRHWHTYIDGSSTFVSNENVMRMAVNKGMHWSFGIHEQLEIDKRYNDYIGIISPVYAYIYHLGYYISQEKLLKKMERNINILKVEIEKNRYNWYLWYQLGQSFHILGDGYSAYRCYINARDLGGKEISGLDIEGRISRLGEKLGIS